MCLYYIWCTDSGILFCCLYWYLFLYLYLLSHLYSYYPKHGTVKLIIVIVWLLPSGFQWDYSDWVQHPESLNNIPEIPPRAPRDSPTNVSTTTSHINEDEDDYETDEDEYVGGDDTDYPPENDDMPIARAAQHFRRELENYPPMDDDYDGLPLNAINMRPGHYLPSHHGGSTSTVPPDYDGIGGSPDQSTPFLVPQRNHLARGPDYRRPISDISQDALSMSMYTSTNASCSDVSALEPDSEINLSEFEFDLEDHLTNLQTSTDV